jgi:hypothetical protein
MKPHSTEGLPDDSSAEMQNDAVRAETVAGLERKRNYDEAARWWRMAADTAHCPHQRNWYESRARLCERWHQAPLAQPVSQ